MIKKFLLKTVIVLVIFLGLASYASYLMTGQPPVAFFSSMFKGAKHRQAESLGDLKTLDAVKTLQTDQGEMIQAGTDTVYKWRDAEGVLHFSNEPPPESAGADQVLVDPNENVIPGVKKPEVVSQANTVPSQDQKGVDPGVLNPYTPSGVQEVMRQAKDVQNQVQKRAEQQQKALQDL